MKVVLQATKVGNEPLIMFDDKETLAVKPDSVIAHLNSAVIDSAMDLRGRGNQHHRK